MDTSPSPSFFTPLQIGLVGACSPVIGFTAIVMNYMTMGQQRRALAWAFGGTATVVAFFGASLHGWLGGWPHQWMWPLLWGLLFCGIGQTCFGNVSRALRPVNGGRLIGFVLIAEGAFSALYLSALWVTTHWSDIAAMAAGR